MTIEDHHRIEIDVYGIKQCDTCRRALKWLDLRNVTRRFHDFRVDGVPEDLLREWLETDFAEHLINRRSTTWRELDETARRGEPVALLQAHPSLMKRPLIVQADGGSTVGWDAAARNALGLG